MNGKPVLFAISYSLTLRITRQELFLYVFHLFWQQYFWGKSNIEKGFSSLGEYSDFLKWLNRLCAKENKSRKLGLFQTTRYSRLVESPRSSPFGNHWKLCDRAGLWVHTSSRNVHKLLSYKTSLVWFWKILALYTSRWSAGKNVTAARISINKNHQLHHVLSRGRGLATKNPQRRTRFLGIQEALKDKRW